MRHLLGPDAVIRTYTVGMAGSTDIAFARKAADYYRTEHHEALLTGTLQSHLGSVRVKTILQHLHFIRMLFSQDPISVVLF